MKWTLNAAPDKTPLQSTDHLAAGSADCLASTHTPPSSECYTAGLFFDNCHNHVNQPMSPRLYVCLSIYSASTLGSSVVPFACSRSDLMKFRRELRVYTDCDGELYKQFNYQKIQLDCLSNSLHGKLIYYTQNQKTTHSYQLVVASSP